MNPTDYDKVRHCRNCVTLGGKHVPSCGSKKSMIMVVTGPPGTREAEEKQLLSGPVGEMFDMFLDEAGIDRASVYISSVLKCQPPGNREPNPEELDMCFGTWLKDELVAVSPKIVVLLGKDAHEAIAGDRIQFKHGHVAKTSKRVYLVLRHPAFFLRKGQPDTFVESGALLKKLILEQPHGK